MSDPDTTSAPTSRKLTEAQWKEIETFYELGQKRIMELAEEYGITRQALSKRFKDNGITYASRASEVKEAADTAVKSAIASTAGQSVLQKLENYADNRKKWVEEARLASVKSLQQAEMIAKKTVGEALRANKPLHTVDEELKAVHRYQRILTENFRSRLEFLKADEILDEGELPTLPLIDLTEDDIKRMQADDELNEDEMASIEEDLASIRALTLPEVVE